MNVTGAWSQQALYELAKRIILSTQSEPYVSDAHISTVSSFSSYKTTEQMTALRTACEEYADSLFSKAGKLSGKLVNEIPDEETAEPNILYYYSPTGEAPFVQYLKIQDTLLNLGSTEVTLTEVVDNLITDKNDAALSARQGMLLDDAKVNKYQGEDNQGKAMVVGEDGLLSPSTIDVDDPAWTGTRAEYEKLDHSLLKDGQQVNITDDYEDLLKDDVVSPLSTWSSEKINEGISEKLNEEDFTNLLKTQKAIRDLNNLEVGKSCTWDTSTSNSPISGYGYCISYSAYLGNWIYQKAYSTDGEEFVRTSINGGQWSAWKQNEKVDNSSYEYSCQIIPYNDGVHIRSFFNKNLSSTTYTDLVLTDKGISYMKINHGQITETKTIVQLVT